MAHCNGDECAKTTNYTADGRRCTCGCQMCVQSRVMPRAGGPEVVDVTLDLSRVDTDPKERSALKKLPWWLALAPILLLVGWGTWNQLSERMLGSGTAEVRCRGDNSGMSCTVKMLGSRPGKVCWAVELQCDGTKHRAEACSDRMDPGSEESVLVRDFSPDLSTVHGQCERARVIETRRAN